MYFVGSLVLRGSSFKPSSTTRDAMETTGRVKLLCAYNTGLVAELVIACSTVRCSANPAKIKPVIFSNSWISDEPHRAPTQHIAHSTRSSGG